MAAADLTTLAAVNAWLGLTGTNNDAVVKPLISAASRFVLNYLSRPSVLPTSFTDRLDGYGWQQQQFTLRNWPVLSISSLLLGSVAVLPSTPAVSGSPPSNGYLIEPWDGQPPGRPQNVDLYGYCVPKGRQVVSVTYTAGYQVTAEPQTVPASGTLTLSAGAPYGPFAADGGVTLADGTALTKVPGTPAASQYSVDGTGTYTFNAAQASAAVLLTYGYVPFDLDQATKELVGERFKYKDRIGEMSKSLGGQETISYSIKDMPDAMKLILQNYKNVVPFQ
jgi:hypothetical protein